MAGGLGNKKGTNKYAFEAKAESVHSEELEIALSSSGKSLTFMRSLPASLRGPELLRIFALDLLGWDTPEAKILRTKLYSHSSHYVVSHQVKMIVSVALFLAMSSMVYATMNFTALKSSTWHQAWLLLSLLQIAVNFVINQGVEATLLHYYIPGMVSDRVRQVRLKLLQVVDDLFSKTPHTDYAGLSRGPEDLPAQGQQPNDDFSSTSYFFVSNYVATHIPELTESALVLSYRDPMPHDSLRRKWLLPREVHLENMKAQGWTGYSGVPARELTGADIAAMATDRLHKTFQERDMERTLQGRLFVLRQKVQLYASRSLSKATAWLVDAVLVFGSIDITKQRVMIQLLQPLLIASVAYGAVMLRHDTGLLTLLILLIASAFMASLLWYRWTLHDRHVLQTNAIAPVPSSNKKKTKSKGDTTLQRPVSGFETEGSLLDEHASIDDQLSDLGSIQEQHHEDDHDADVESSESSSGTSSRKSSIDKTNGDEEDSDNFSIDTAELEITDSEEEEEKREKENAREAGDAAAAAFEAGVAAGIAAASGAGVVTVPVNIRSRPNSTADDTMHEDHHPHNHEEDSDDEWHGYHKRNHDDDIESKTSGSSQEYHLSHIIRKHAGSSGAPAAGATGSFKKPKAKQRTLEEVREAAMKPFEMPKRMRGVDRELADRQ